MKGSHTFHGHSLSGNLQQYHYPKNKLLDRPIKCLTERSEDDQEILRARFLANLRRWPKSITSEPGNQFIKEFLLLLGDKTITVKKADKGTTTVIMSREQKIKEGQILLNDLDNYTPLEKNKWLSKELKK